MTTKRQTKTPKAPKPPYGFRPATAKDLAAPKPNGLICWIRLDRRWSAGCDGSAPYYDNVAYAVPVSTIPDGYRPVLPGETTGIRKPAEARRLVPGPGRSWDWEDTPDDGVWRDPYESLHIVPKGLMLMPSKPPSPEWSAGGVCVPADAAASAAEAPGIVMPDDPADLREQVERHKGDADHCRKALHEVQAKMDRQDAEIADLKARLERAEPFERRWQSAEKERLALKATVDGQRARNLKLIGEMLDAKTRLEKSERFAAELLVELNFVRAIVAHHVGFKDLPALGVKEKE